MKFFKKIYYRCLFTLNFSQNKRAKNTDINNYADLVVINPMPPEQVQSIPKLIWLYWEGNIPVLVQRCMDRMKTLHPDYQVHILSPDNVAQFCSFDLQQPLFQQATPQQRADLIRFNLIYQYGGIWLDASTLVYERLDWINELIIEHGVNSFSYYRAKNTTQIDYPVIENWLLASVPKNEFYLKWFDELFNALSMGVQNYIQEIKKQANHAELFQEIGRLEYLVAYVACQKVMRSFPISMVLINCDQNAFKYQVSHQWLKEKVLIDLALNHAPNEMPKLIKLAGKERKILEKHYAQKKYFPQSLLDI